jgi:hypothetical protein
MDDLQGLHQIQIMVDNGRDFLDSLINAARNRSIITKICVKSCGIAFLSNHKDMLPELEHLMRNVRCIDLSIDLFTREAFEWANGLLTLTCIAHQKTALNTAVSHGSLGKFLMMAHDLEILILALQCHEIANPMVEEGDLVLLLRNRTWSHLGRLELSGICTSQIELEGLIDRHRYCVQQLKLSDIVLKTGSWPSFFNNLRVILEHSQLSPESFHLSGHLFFHDSLTLEIMVWDLDAPWAGNWTVREHMTNTVFLHNFASLMLFDVEQLANLAI